MVADLLAKPIRVGFLDGVALVILAGQLPRLFDLPVDDDAVLPRLRDLVVDLADGQGSATAAWLGGGTIAVWLALRPRFGALALPTAVSALTTVGVLAGAHDRVAVIGAMHGAWGLIDVRELRWSDVLTLLPAAGGIAIVAFADTAALSRSLSDRTGSSSDDGDEMSALGLTNAAVGVLGGFPVSASSTRTPAALAAGASTRVCTVVAGVAIATLMLAAPGVTRYVPTSVLSAAIIVAALYLVDVHSLRRWWRVSRGDFLVSCTAFAGVVMLDVLRGIGLAVALAAALFVVRSWRPHCAELVRVDERKGYHDAARHPDGRRIPGLVIARFDAPLFFANARTFSRFVLGLVDAAPSPVQRVIVAAEPITDVDVTAADELADLLDRLAERGITLDLAEAKGPVKDRLRRYGLTVRARAFPTVGTAVRAYLRETGTPWVDWEDRPADQVGAASPEDRSLAPARDRAKRLE
jgi:MFS superfamily sulfate permease-like transporter